MKQLHKQISARRDEEIPTPQTPPYSPKTLKHHRSLPRSIHYLFREQRLLFILVGILIGSTFFILQPTLSRLAPSEAHSSVPRSFSTDAVKTATNDVAHIQESSTSYSIPANKPFQNKVGRVPVGIGRRRMRIVVTGGAGFVGSHLVDKLIKRGDEVIVIDNFFTGRKENLRVGARFLLTSTSEVYGDPLEHPQKETYWGNVNPIGERSCYDEGKRTAETLTMDYHRGAGVEVRIARIFNTYGPRMCLDDGRVVSNFVAQAIRKKPMTVYGDGKQTRSFQYVSDLVDGLYALMEGEHIGPFNLGNPGEFTMLELAEVVKETIDPSATIEYRPNTADDPHMRKPDISKAKELLNWEPKIFLRDGLPLMVSDFRNRILNEDEGKGAR
ncbi:NAD-dependent epimerase/dehydratase [Corchorus capsularis]|uniref:UDP-glucuronate decarboxylase n=1 Tax=Corchorus capsularis TaxID=210143 RepID=A0A1R3HQT9_COCAP|nr:NAD-dependent epimerase/dehydratase [Corchorus capsularis]